MLVMAMDRASVRRRTAFGHMQVARSNISKANICPYYGREIPRFRELGLDGDRIYRMLRDPEELRKAASTFNGLPLLDRHIPVTADSWPDEAVVGASGTDANFDDLYLTNSLVVWTRGAIDGITSKRKRELSCGYGYRADMTPGTYEGLPYDGVMRDIVGNHITLVIAGRAGSDVIVGDEAMKSRRALMLSGALAGLIAPMLAQDAKADLSPALADVTDESLAADGAPAALAAKVVEIVTPHLAQDQEISTEVVEIAIQAASALALDGDDEIAEAPASEPGKPAPKQIIAPVVQRIGLDEATVQGMIATARDEALATGKAEAAALEVAKDEVFPYVGKVTGLDSAEAVYRMALDHAKVDLKGVDPVAFGPMVRMLPKPGSVRLAQDSRPASGGSLLAAIVPDLQPAKVV